MITDFNSWSDELLKNTLYDLILNMRSLTKEELDFIELLQEECDKRGLSNEQAK